jgi:hypothetical protein
MTGSANCDIVSKRRRDLCGVKCIGVIRYSDLETLWLSRETVGVTGNKGA